MDNGYALVMVSVLDENKSVAVIHDLIVHSDRRGIGLGRALLEEACKEGKRMGADTLSLSAAPGSWLEEWYKRHGFEYVRFSPSFGNVLQKPVEI